jgi:hypothetical protein
MWDTESFRVRTKKDTAETFFAVRQEVYSMLNWVWFLWLLLLSSRSNLSCAIAFQIYY